MTVDNSKAEQSKNFRNGNDNVSTDETNRIVKIRNPRSH